MQFLCRAECNSRSHLADCRPLEGLLENLRILSTDSDEYIIFYDDSHFDRAFGLYDIIETQMFY